MAFVGDSLGLHAETRPTGLALKSGHRTWSWSELHSEINALARAISARVPAGARAALCLDDPADLLIAFLAGARAGALAMVFDASWTVPRRAWVEKQVRPDILVDTQNLDDLRASKLELPAVGAPVASDLFYAGFTSGSTGDPKGYCRSHGSWLDSFRLSEAEFQIGPNDRIVIPGGLAHSLHLYGAVHGLCAGASVEVVRRFNPKFLADRLRAASNTVLYATPTQIHYLAEELIRSGGAETVRLVLASGAKWQPNDRRHLAKVLPDARLVEFYGASEMSFITLSVPEELIPDGSVGRAASGVKIAIGDPEASNEPGVTGLIWVKSALLFDHYICGGGEEIRWKDGWLTVGDRGFVDDNGYLFLAGREKRMIVTSGLNVYPEEIERILEEEDCVRSSAVFGLADPVRGARLVAAVDSSGDPDQLEARLRRLCLSQLGQAKTPHEFRFVSNWPLTVGGKTDLKALERMIAGESGCEAAE